MRVTSPAQLARQAVRYLRSCVIAKIAGMTPENTTDGMGSELLQISRRMSRGGRHGRRRCLPRKS